LQVEFVQKFKSTNPELSAELNSIIHSQGFENMLGLTGMEAITFVIEGPLFFLHLIEQSEGVISNAHVVLQA
jgi:hypothetical protein